MKSEKKKFLKAMFGRTLVVSGLFMLGILFFMNEPKVVLNSVSNVDSARSIEAYHMISRYDNREKILTVKPVLDMNEAAI